MASNLRREFRLGFWKGIKIIWPILAVLLSLMALLGMAVAILEGWPLSDGLYFAFVSGLTIGYGDLAAKGLLARALAITIGLTGVIFAGLIAAIGVQALQMALKSADDR
jgi:Ion channel